MPRKSLTTEEFNQKVFDIHKGKYGTDKVIFKNLTTKVILTCPIHGDFEVYPHNILNGQGCYWCGREVTKNKIKKGKEKFINQSRELYGDLFDYSEVEYVNGHTEVCLICHRINPKNGEEYGRIYQTPVSHLKHLPRILSNEETSKRQRSNTEEFIKKLNKKYPGKFDTSKVEYKTNRTPIILISHDIDPITEKEYGEFTVTPSKALSGQDHPTKSNILLHTRDELIQYFTRIHKNTTYEHFEHPSSEKYRIMTCTIHGDYKQTIRHHADGEGCPICGGRLKGDTERFKNEFVKVYEDLYDISNAEYVDAHTKIGIPCPKHGIQYRTPGQWLKGGGCPKCKATMGEIEIENALKKNKILFYSQHRFDWLRTKKGRQQSIDVFIPEYNIAVEIQGGQHFREIEKYGGAEGLKIVSERDENKRRLLKEHNINLVYFTKEYTITEEYTGKFFVYQDSNKLIEDILNNRIKTIYDTTNPKTTR